jgi:hypothetical protein
VIPNSVTTISNNAFEECTSPASIVIPNSVTTLGNYAFCKECTSLKSIEIPASVTTIGNTAFFYANPLLRLRFQIASRPLDPGPFMNAHLDAISSIESFEIPNISVTTIGNNLNILAVDYD